MIATIDLFTAVRSFILVIVPNVEVVRGLSNGVPMPRGGFIALSPVRQQRLSTNHHAYADPTPTTGTMTVSQSAQFDMQIDCYGPLSGDWAMSISTMLRDQYGCDALGANIKPLYADDPMQSPLIDGEENYEERWMLTAAMQYNPSIVTPMQFFDQAKITTVIEANK